MRSLAGCLCALLLCSPGVVAAAAGKKSAPKTAQPSALPVQVALDRAGYSTGEIDGRAGGNTQKAVAAFQERHGIAPTGIADPATLDALRAAIPGEALAIYTITPEDAGGPFLDAIPDDMMDKAALPHLGYTSILELLGERFHTKPDLLRRLNPHASFAAGEEIRVPDVAGRTIAEKAAMVTVSKSRSVLEVVDRSGRLIFFAPITAGSEHDPLPLGDWKVKGVARNPAFNYDPELFWNADPTHAKAQIPAGPNNPVGVVWIELDKEHYGIHGTDQPSRVGHAESHGCIRMTNWDALALALMVEPGTPVLFVQ